MITTCSMRHLYNAKPKNETLILQAKEYERRRCNHQDLDEPLSSLECLESVVDGKGNGTNKNRYIVASDELEVRKKMRAIAGVPLIYISKSVVLMEPMAGASEERRDIEEKSKFKQGLKGQRKPEQMQKRKREEDEEVGGNEKGVDGAMEEARTAKNKRQRGPKQPNPLSMKKAKKETDAAPMPKKSKSSIDGESASAPSKPDDEASSGRKRKRRPKAKADGDVSQTAEDAGSP